MFGFKRRLRRKCKGSSNEISGTGDRSATIGEDATSQDALESFSELTDGVQSISPSVVCRLHVKAGEGCPTSTLDTLNQRTPAQKEKENITQLSILG